MDRRKPLFVITDSGWLRLGKVDSHDQLFRRGEGGCGGGYYELDLDNNRLVLMVSEFFYDPPNWIRLEKLRISAMYEGMRIIFKSSSSEGDEVDLEKMLEVEFR